MQLTYKEFDTVQHIYEEAKALGRAGLKQEASAKGTKALEIFNQAAIKNIETGNYKHKEDLIYTDISVSMPVKAGTKDYQLKLLLVADSPLEQEILAVLKKYHELGYPGVREEEEIDLSRIQF